MKRRNILSVLLAACSVASFADTTGVLSEDGRVLTVNVSGQEGFNPELISATVTNLVKTGEGSLTVSADISSWTGSITVSEGTYIATSSAALGDVTSGQGGAVVVKDGATLELTGNGTLFTMPKKSFVIGGTGVSGRGAVVYSGDGEGAFNKVSLGNNITLSTDALVAVEGNFHVYWNNPPTYIRLNGHVLTLKPYKSRSFILGYANTPDPQGGEIVIDGNTLCLMNPSAAISGDGTVTVANSALVELSTLSGTFDWRLDVNEGGSFRSKAKLDPGAVHTNMNVFGGPVSLPNGITPFSIGYAGGNRFGGTVSFRGKISGGGFSVTKDSRITDAQFHLFNPGNDFTDGIAAASGVDVYLWANGALPAEGGSLSLNGGRLFLNAPYFALPGANFTGGSSVFGGTGRWSKDVVKTGEGTLRYNSAVDGVKLDVKEGGVSFNAADRSKIAGLYEGSYAYKKGTRPDYTDFFYSKNFPTNSIVAGTLCSYDSNYALWKFPDVDGNNTRAVIAYKGYLWNNSPEPVTWAFAGSEAATTYLEIGGKCVYEQVYQDSEKIKHIGHGTATLQPGSNTFLYVVYAGGLTGGPNHWFSDGTPAADGNWKNDFGLAVNKSGIDSLLVDDYEPLMDPGDGSVYTYALPGQSDIVRPGVETPPSDLNGTLPTFGAMTFAAGTTVDFGGASSYRVETLEGAPAVYGVDKFSIASQWVMDVEDFAGGVKLTVPGSLELSGGLALTVKNARRFRSVAADGKLLIAEAPDGIALGETEMVSDMAGRGFRLELSEDGKALYLAVKEKGLYLLVK